MSESTQRRVLVVTGDPTRAAKLERALDHPQLAVTLGQEEQSIVSQLSSSAWDLAVVGGHVGRRGPLVLCDAVRARQATLPILVLVGRETNEAELTAHEERGLEGVRYLDLRSATATIAELKSARLMALNMLGLAEDPESAEDWPPRVEELDRRRAQHEDEVELTDEIIEEEVPALLVEPVTREDLDFARRIIEQTRHVDFRSPVPRTQVADPADRQIAKLRDRVRELEVNIARLAHVYGGRLRELDGAVERIAEAQARYERLKKDSERLREHYGEERERWKVMRVELDSKITALADKAHLLEEHLRDATEETGRLRHELGAKENSYASLMQQAQEAFSTLRDSTAQSAARYEEQIATLGQQLNEACQQNEQLQADLVRAREEQAQQITSASQEYAQQLANLQEQLHSRVQKLEAELDDSRQRYDAEVTTAHQRNEAHAAQVREVQERSAQQLREIEQRTDAELRHRASELDQLRSELGQATNHIQELQSQLAAACEEARRHEAEASACKSEIAQLEGSSGQLSAELQGLRAELSATQQETQRLGARCQDVEQHNVQAQVELQSSSRTHAAELEHLRSEQAAREARWQEKNEELKQAASTFRQAHEEQLSTASELEAALGKVRLDLEARDNELALLRSQCREAAEMLERERTRSLESVLDARLVAVEEFARGAAERIKEQRDVLALIEERSRKQERVVDVLLGSMDSDTPDAADAPHVPGSAGQSGTTGRRDTDEELAKLAKRLVDARAHESKRPPSLWAWLKSSPIHLAGAGFASTLVVAAALFGLSSALDSPAVEPNPAAPRVAGEAIASSQLTRKSQVEKDRPKGDERDSGQSDKDAEQETSTAEQQASAPDESNEPRDAATIRKELSPKDQQRRRTLRGKFFAAYKGKRWAEAIQQGRELRDAYYLDWESHFRLADSLRRANNLEDALGLYRQFLEVYPDNLFAEEARLRIADALVKLERPAEAVPYYEKLAAESKGKLRDKARQALKKLERR